MKLRELRAQGRIELAASKIEGSIQLEIDLLLGELLGVSREKLLIRLDEAVDLNTQGRFWSLVERRKSHEPMAYILGRKEFYGEEFIVSPDVLIPRPETELLVELAFAKLELLFPEPSATLSEEISIYDVGTGSGVIILSLMNLLRRRKGTSSLDKIKWYATDISEKALAVGLRNACKLKLDDYVEFKRADLLESMHEDHAKKIIVSNPPYIGEDGKLCLAKDIVDYEPDLALFGGENGFELVDKLIKQAVSNCSIGDSIFVEIGINQAYDLSCILDFLEHLTYRFHKDLGGIERILEINIK